MAMSTLNDNKSSAPPIWRRNYLIKKKLQIHFAVMSFVLILVSTIAVWFLMSWSLQSSQLGDFMNGKEMQEYFLKTNYVIMIMILADALAAGVMSIFFSHYIAGPIFRLERALADMVSEKGASPITLRKHDMLKDTVALANTAICYVAALRANVKELREQLEKQNKKND